MNQRFLTIAALVTAVAGGIAVAVPPPVKTTPAPQLTKAQTDFFEAKVRPLLSDRCYKCHSADSQKVKGNLLLDSREGCLKGGDTGPAVVPGNVGASLLIKAITYKDADLQMPPKGEKLSDADIATLTEWVKMGAPDPRSAAGTKLSGLTDKARQHWAYQPIKRQQVPVVKDQSWVKNPVDAFVLAKLEQNNMKPSAAASKETLIRRATYDVTGLPATPEELSAFVHDDGPNAWEKVVDRLLASPHYGERWGRFWLDSARYSDTSGEEKLKKDDYRFAFAWTYRDYVIKSFNDDKPYDRFLMEQLAADQMGGSSSDNSRLAALGFLTVGKKFQNPNDTIDERIDAISKSMMGLTVACARCHDHKFDPIPTADYYSLHGILASTYEPEEKPLIGKATDGPDYQDYLKQLAGLEAKNREIYYDLIAEKSAEFRKNASAYLQVGLLGRKNKDKDDLVARQKLIQENKLDDDLFRSIRPGEDVSVFLPLLRAGQAESARDFSRIAEEAASGQINRRPVNALVAAAFRATSSNQVTSMKDLCAVYGKLFAEIDPKAKQYLELSRTAKADLSGFDPNLVALIDFPTPIAPAFKLDTEHLKDFIQKLPVKNNNAYQKFAFPAINELEMTHPGAPPHAMIVADVPQPKNSPIFIRGEAQNRGPVVPRRFLEIIAGPNRAPFTRGSGRYELAEAITSKANPLTARVAVNRIWLHHFGEGFVRTPDDLGVQSEPPSHPELLDYLAKRFMDENWSYKKMHKLILMSNTYQLSSDTEAEYAQKDPANRLLWHANLRRLDFEAIRDSMLQLTGNLDGALFGKPVNLTDEPYSNRRSVYGYVDRGDLPELMQQFDFSDPDMANSHRTSTIVPQQALFFMNSPMSADVARKVTTRAEFTDAKSDADRVQAIYHTMFQREARPEEVQFALEFVGSDEGDDNLPPPLKDGKGQPMNRRKDGFKPKQNGKKGGGRAPIQNKGEMVERKPLTAWELFGQTLMFTNEFAYVN